VETVEPILMNTEQKKALLLLKLVIFNYHGLDEEEKKILADTAVKLDAQEELKWAYDFSEQDNITSFERAREFFKTTIGTYEKDSKLDFIRSVWDDTQSKGYVSEIEAMSMLKLAKDWGIQKDLLALVRK
jgi:hypothetical protein